MSDLEHDLNQDEKHVLNMCPFCAYHVDTSRKLTFANDPFLSLYNLELSDLLGMTANDFYSEDLAEKYARDDLHVLQNEVIFSTVEHNEDPNTGLNRLVEVVKMPTYDERGQVDGIRGLFWDITDLVDDDSDVLSYWNRLLKMNAVDDFLLIDQQGDILLGTGELNGSFLDVVSQHERHQVFSHIKRAFQDTSVELFNLYTQHTDQFWSCRLVPCLSDNEQTPMAALFVVDVTHQISLQASTERDLRLGLLTRYSAAVAHDLNNLFTVLMCNASLLEPQNEEDAELIDDILQATRRSQGLVAQMRTFVQPDTTSYEWVNMRRFFEEKRALLDRVLGRQTILEVIWSSINGDVYINQSRFEQLVLSLLLNLQNQVQDPTSLEIAMVVPCEFPPVIQVRLAQHQESGVRFEPLEKINLSERSGRDWRDLVFADQVMRLFGGSFQARALAGDGVMFILELPLSPTDE